MASTPVQRAQVKICAIWQHATKNVGPCVRSVLGGMAKVKEFVVDTLASFAEKMEELLAATLTRQAGSPYGGNWYRGVGRSGAHTLLPSLYRHPTLKAVDELIKLERLMLDDFARQNILHPSPMRVGENIDDFRALFFISTTGFQPACLTGQAIPLLDCISRLHRRSASQGPMSSIEDAAVWVLDPVTWNDYALTDVSYGKEGPISLESEESKAYRPRKLIKGALETNAIKTLYERPVAILGLSNNARMFAQRGVFTVFGKVLDAMEDQYDKDGFPADSLSKLVVPKQKISELSERLLRIGYTDSVSYPDLHGLAMEIKRSRGFRV